MVSSPMYRPPHRSLLEGVRTPASSAAMTPEHSTIIAGMGMMSARVSTSRNTRVSRERASAIDGWIDGTQQRYSSERQGYVTGTVNTGCRGSTPARARRRGR